MQERMVLHPTQSPGEVKYGSEKLVCPSSVKISNKSRWYKKVKYNAAKVSFQILDFSQPWLNKKHFWNIYFSLHSSVIRSLSCCLYFQNLIQTLIWWLRHPYSGTFLWLVWNHPRCRQDLVAVLAAVAVGRLVDLKYNVIHFTCHLIGLLQLWKSSKNFNTMCQNTVHVLWHYDGRNKTTKYGNITDWELIHIENTIYTCSFILKWNWYYTQQNR